MAWFYNPILCRFLRIGLFAALRRHYDPAATVVHKSAFSPRISQTFKLLAPQEAQKNMVFNGLFHQANFGPFCLWEEPICPQWLVLVPAIPAFGVLREALADFVAQEFSVDGFAFELGARGLDHRAHLLRRVRAGLGDGVFDGAQNFRVVGSGRKIVFDDFDFARFFFREIVAAAFCELLDGFVALFDERLQDLQRFQIFERAHLFDFFVFQRGLDHAQDAQAQFVFFLHGRGQIFLDMFHQAHVFEFSSVRSCT